MDNVKVAIVQAQSFGQPSLLGSPVFWAAQSAGHEAVYQIYTK
ncbi:MAG: hypothetical protein WA996_08785 [Candidatus Promineifilaceae bacterium]